MHLLAALLLLPLSLAATITGRLAPSPHLPDPSTLPPHTAITLSSSHTHLSTLLRADHTFSLTAPAGSYLLTIATPSHPIPPIRIDINSDDQISAHQTFRGNPWSNLGPKLDLPLVLVPTAHVSPFVAREGFNPWKMLMGNPMILVAVISLVAMVGVPKLMDKMDPEFKKEFDEQQKKTSGAMAGAQDPLGGLDIAGFLAGKSSPAEEKKGKAQKRR